MSNSKNQNDSCQNDLPPKQPDSNQGQQHQNQQQTEKNEKNNKQKEHSPAPEQKQ